MADDPGAIARDLKELAERVSRLPIVTLGNEVTIERFDVLSPDNTVWTGQLLQSPHRGSGRRIRVFRPGETMELLFDSDWCYDQANARAALDEWLDGVYKKHSST